jgi:hypothetical protein
MIQVLARRLKIPVWRLRGYDSFAGHWYLIEGIHFSESGALRAAEKQLQKLERSQPSSTSGGQDGIQDQVYVVRPDGTQFRYVSQKNRK